MKPLPIDGPESDGARSHAVYIAAKREQCIRRHQVQPDRDNPDEVRWAREGDRPVNQLDTALSGKPWER
jgi:hypothetical protein